MRNLHAGYVTGLEFVLATPGSEVRRAADWITEPKIIIKKKTYLKYIQFLHHPNYNIKEPPFMAGNL